MMRGTSQLCHKVTISLEWENPGSKLTAPVVLKLVKWLDSEVEIIQVFLFCSSSLNFDFYDTFDAS